MRRLLAVVLSLPLMACQGLAEDQGRAGGGGPAPDELLRSAAGYVVATPPSGIEVRVGSKRVRDAGQHAPDDGISE